MNRLNKLREKMQEEKVENFIITSKEVVGYITGNFGEDALLCVNKEECIYITDDRYIGALKEKLDKEIKLVNISSSKEYKTFFKTNTAYIEEEEVTIARRNEICSMFNLSETKDGSKILHDMQIVKDEDEISCIKKACKITDDCYTFICKYVKEGMTEKQIKAEINKYYEIHADGVAFETIVAIDENSAIPHAVSSEKKVKDGSVILIDMGSKYKGYASDMTRCILYGNVSEKVKTIYNEVLEIQKKCIEEVKSNIVCKSLNAHFVNALDKKNYKILHSLGHGVGIYINEKPFVSRSSDTVLKENMVITIEPVIYLENEFGIRIEDTVLVKKDGVEVITSSRK